LIRVAIQAGTTATRAGLHALLQGDPEIQVVKESAARDGLQGMLVEIDVLIWLPDGGGEWIADWVVTEQFPPGCAVLVIGEEGVAVALATEGPRVWGYLPAEFSGEELTSVVHSLALGFVVAPPTLINQRISRQQAKVLPIDQRGQNPLTPREAQILQYLAQGMANKQIAEILKISPNTVKYHLASIYEKIGATNRADAVTRGMQQGLLSL
jgi:DNA-binding NarL/FixJ family response regulator